MKRCFFIGHREASERIFQVLCDTIEVHITEYDVAEFVVGQHGNFDRLVAKALMEAKQRHPHIRIVALTPYHPAEHKKPLPVGFDGSIYPEGLESVPRRYAIVRANRYMIDHSDYLIAYVTHPASNAYNLVEYARKIDKTIGIKIENIADII